MTIDTRLVNARLVDGTGVHQSALSIDQGHLVADQETDDVWRTVDASGHVVIPGLIQPAVATGDTALIWAKRGTTTAITNRKPHEPAKRESASMDWVDSVVVTSGSEVASALEEGVRVFVPVGLSPSDVPALVEHVVLRLNGDTDSVEDWLANSRATLIVSSDLAGTADLAGTERVTIELQGPEIMADECGALWDLVNSDKRVVVTSGGDASFPLLQFLYHEGHINRGTPLGRIADVVSLNAAACYGLTSKSGYEIGNDGDLVVFDPESDDPYLDAAWPGRVIFSLQRGNILLYNGELHTTPGDGRTVESG